MLLRFFCLLFITILCNEAINAISVRRQEVKDTRVPVNPYGVTNLDYDFDTPRIFPYRGYRQKSKSNQNASPTTPRPFMSYWQNIMRNVRVPVPSISWNVTNPLANLFNMGNDQPLDTTHSEDYYSLNSQRRHKQNRRRKNSHKKRHRKNKHPIVTAEQEQQNQIALEEQQMLLPQYPNGLDPDEAMYFYDPNTDAYYAVQRVRALGSYIQGNYYNPQLISSHAVTAIAKDELDTPINVPVDNESANTEDTQTASVDVDDSESVINLAEAEEIDLDKIDAHQPPKNVAPKEQEKSQTGLMNEETLRSVLGTYMLDDPFNRQRQRTKDQRRESITIKQKPRNNLKYYFLLNRN